MELNMISAGIELLGITVKELEVHNQIVVLKWMPNVFLA